MPGAPTPIFGIPRIMGADDADVVTDLNAALLSIETIINSLVPVGAVIDYGVPLPGADPDGGLLAVPDGRTLNSVTDATLSRLYAKIGTSFGGTGASAFKLPDYRDVYRAYASDMGTQGTAPANNFHNQASFNSFIGERLHQMSIAEMPGHTHPTSVDAPSFFYVEGGGGADYNELAFGTSTLDVRKATPTTGSTGGNTAHENRPPTKICTCLIRIR